MWSLRDKGIKGLKSMVFILFSGGKALIILAFKIIFLNDYAKTIKEICNESGLNFE